MTGPICLLLPWTDRQPCSDLHLHINMICYLGQAHILLQHNISSTWKVKERMVDVSLLPLSLCIHVSAEQPVIVVVKFSCN